MSAAPSRRAALSVPVAERPRAGRPLGRHLRAVVPSTPSGPLPVIVATAIVVVALLALAASHALLIGGQLRLDDLNRSLSAQQEEARLLRLRVAELEAPDRILDAARTRLGMVEPAEVGYLLPANVVGDDDPVRVVPAEPPPAPAPATPAASPEQQAVDADADGAGDAAEADDRASTETAPAPVPDADADEVPAGSDPEPATEPVVVVEGDFDVGDG